MNIVKKEESRQRQGVVAPALACGAARANERNESAHRADAARRTLSPEADIWTSMIR